MASPTHWLSFLPAAIAKLERAKGGRLGVAPLDTCTGGRSGHHQKERFPMRITFKFVLVSAVLQRVDRHQETLHGAVEIPLKSTIFGSGGFGATLGA